MNYTITPFSGQSDDGEGQCSLLGPFALFVQGALGGLALLSLVFKRWREKPRRPVKVWWFDVSKQVVGSVLVHVANLGMSMFSSGTLPMPGDGDDGSGNSLGEDPEYHPNPCSFYLLNLLIDTTIGIAILIYALRLITSLCLMLPETYAFSHGITTGDYGRPPKARNWLKQSLIYFAGLMVMKSVVLTIFQFAPWLGRVGDWALRWTEGNRKVQIAFVMFIFPLIMNAIQYYIIDTFIQKQDKSPQLGDDDGEGGRGDDEEEDDDDLTREHSDDSDAREIGMDSNNPELQPSAAAAVGGMDGKRNVKTRMTAAEESDEDDAREDRSLLKPSQSTKTQVKNIQNHNGDEVSSSGSSGRIKLVDNSKEGRKK